MPVIPESASIGLWGAETGGGAGALGGWPEAGMLGWLAKESVRMGGGNYTFSSRLEC